MMGPEREHDGAIAADLESEGRTATQILCLFQSNHKLTERQTERGAETH